MPHCTTDITDKLNDPPTQIRLPKLYSCTTEEQLEELWLKTAHLREEGSHEKGMQFYSSHEPSIFSKRNQTSTFGPHTRLKGFNVNLTKAKGRRMTLFRRHRGWLFAEEG